MPIYEYRCASCGFEDEFLQKVSEPLLTECPKCGKPTFEKQVSAAGFQLKGNGWYATDFKNSGAKPAAKNKSDAETGKSDAETGKSNKFDADKPAAETSKSEPDKPTDTKKEAKSESA